MRTRRQQNRGNPLSLNARLDQVEGLPQTAGMAMRRRAAGVTVGVRPGEGLVAVDRLSWWVI